GRARRDRPRCAHCDLGAVGGRLTLPVSAVSFGTVQHRERQPDLWHSIDGTLLRGRGQPVSGLHGAAAVGRCTLLFVGGWARKGPGWLSRQRRPCSLPTRRIRTEGATRALSTDVPGTEKVKTGMGESAAATSRVIIVRPTYNERQNLEIIVGRIRESVPDADLLVVDDNSPDGTGDLADKLAETDRHVEVMHRTEKAGLGRAYVAGFTWALERGYDVIVEMDADGAHRPEDPSTLLAALSGADAVIGSRYVPGGTVVNWPKSREFLSRSANMYNRLMLGFSVKDATGGFRAYRSATLRRLDLSNIESAGYCFQIDMTLRVLQAGPVLFAVATPLSGRGAGALQKAQPGNREAFFRVTQWGITARLR